MRPFTALISVSSSSINAPAFLTLVVLAVNLAVFNATSLAIEALNSVDEPDIEALFKVFIVFISANSESINAPALVTFEVLAVSLAVFNATSEAIEELTEVNEPDIEAFFRFFTVAISASSESINAPAEVTLEVLAVSFTVFNATSEAIEELKEVNEPDIVASVLEPGISVRPDALPTKVFAIILPEALIIEAVTGLFKEIPLWSVLGPAPICNMPLVSNKVGFPPKDAIENPEFALLP